MIDDGTTIVGHPCDVATGSLVIELLCPMQDRWPITVPVASPWALRLEERGFVVLAVSSGSWVVISVLTVTAGCTQELHADVIVFDSRDFR